MTDLIKRLREADEYEPLGHDGWEAADRIEKLEHEVSSHKITISMMNFAWNQALQQRDEAEAKLAKAVEALREIADFSEADPVKYIQGVDAIALDVLAELEGNDDLSTM